MDPGAREVRLEVPAFQGADQALSALWGQGAVHSMGTGHHVCVWANYLMGVDPL